MGLEDPKSGSMGQEDLQRLWRTSNSPGGPPTALEDLQQAGGPPMDLEDPKSGSMGLEDIYGGEGPPTALQVL